MGAVLPACGKLSTSRDARRAGGGAATAGSGSGAGALGFVAGDYLTGTYRELYEAWCEEHGVEPADMTFPETNE